MPTPENDTEYQKLPEQHREGMRLYVEEGILPGSFLTSVLRNDLIEAVAHCSGPIHDLKIVVTWLYSEAPSKCWGSPKQVRDWILGRNDSGG